MTDSWARGDSAHGPSFANGSSHNAGPAGSAEMGQDPTRPGAGDQLADSVTRYPE
jgi:hypothetical protein